MNWNQNQEEFLRELSPEVGRFVSRVLRHLEHENVFDAPSVISAVLREMRIADSDVIRGATGRAERLLVSRFVQQGLRRVDV